jgi:putative glycosyltransferase (TIGR04372 family)
MKKIAKIFLQIPALLVLIVLRILRPVLRVELCIVAFHRFGHLALEPEIYLGELEIRSAQRDGRRFPITVQWWSLGPKKLQANRYLATKWKQVIRVLPSWWIDALHSVGTKISMLRLVEPHMSIRGSLNSLDRTDAQLELTDNEIAEGMSQLRAIGIDPNKPYACLVVRDGGYYASLGEKESDGYSFLNFDISTFEQAALSLVQRGYQVVRMGAGSAATFGAEHSTVIDYANSNLRSEFLDIYIAATCSFAISTQTGPDAVCLAFRRPVCYVDVTRFSQFFFGTKLAWWNPAELWQGDSRLTLRDILRGPIFWIKDPNDFIRQGVRQVRSGAEKIDHLVMSFVDAFENDVNRSNEIDEKVHSVRDIIERETGDRGKSEFGEIHAVLNSGFVELIQESRHFMS